MKTEVFLEPEDGWVYITSKFEEGDRPFGKWLWNVQFILGHEKDTNRTLMFGVYDPKAGKFLVKWKGIEAIKKEAVAIIQAILDKGGYKAVTVMPSEQLGSGFISVEPNAGVQTAKIDNETVDALRNSLDYIQNLA